jgi:hypothetical protein
VLAGKPQKKNQFLAGNANMYSDNPDIRVFHNFYGEKKNCRGLQMVWEFSK